jgi:hypothetical protein
LSKKKPVLAYSLFIFFVLLTALFFFLKKSSLIDNIWQKDLIIKKPFFSNYVEKENGLELKNKIIKPEINEHTQENDIKRTKKNIIKKTKSDLRKKNSITNKSKERKLKNDPPIDNKVEAENNSESIIKNQIDFVTLLKQKEYFKCIEATRNIYNENDTAFLCYLGSLIETGQYNKVNDLIFAKDIDDAYMFYLRGKYSLKRKNYDHAELMFLEVYKFNSFVNINERVNFYFVINSIEKFLATPNNSNKIYAKKNIEDYVFSYCSDNNQPYCDNFRYFLSSFSYKEIKDKYSSVDF